jgi:hypothetical protein
VAQPTDDSNATILPEPELNPLLNPLLAAHMGRWAEVYFTSPPEKRAQAVSDLVRELANCLMPEAGLSARASDIHAWRRTDEEFEKDSTPTLSRASGQQDATLGARAQESTTRLAAIFDVSRDKATGNENGPFEVGTDVSATCESCGYVNAPQQRFCVMCGTPLVVPDENPVPQFEKTQLSTTAAWDEPNAQNDRNHADETHLAAELFQGKQPADEYQTESSAPTEYWSEEGPAEESTQFSVLSGYQSEPASKGYRIYIGLAVAILLGLLVYMTWRSNAAFWSNGTPSLPQAVPAPESQPVAAEPATATPSTSQPATKTATAPTPAASSSPTEKTAANIRQPEARRMNRRAQVHAATRSETPASTSGARQADQDGFEELATAERYLHSGPGTARDSRQAATWLWKAVAKQNATASVMLSDLYLRGDGVGKSCDQARLLLDAASRRGATAAAERLRNLQAFGCR